MINDLKQWKKSKPVKDYQVDLSNNLSMGYSADDDVLLISHNDQIEDLVLDKNEMYNLYEALNELLRPEVLHVDVSGKSDEEIDKIIKKMKKLNHKLNKYQQFIF